MVPSVGMNSRVGGQGIFSFVAIRWNPENDKTFPKKKAIHDLRNTNWTMRIAKSCCSGKSSSRHLTRTTGKSLKKGCKQQLFADLWAKSGTIEPHEWAAMHASLLKNKIPCETDPVKCYNLVNADGGKNIDFNEFSKYLLRYWVPRGKSPQFLCSHIVLCSIGSRVFIKNLNERMPFFLLFSFPITKRTLSEESTSFAWTMLWIRTFG